MSSDTTKAQLAEAKALIQQKRYADARKVLKKVNHPTARAWEVKLDALSPQPVRKRRRWLLAIIAVLIVVIAAPVIIFAVQYGTSCRPFQWYADSASPSVKHFLDTAESATKTSRVAISPLILDLRQAKRDFEAVATSSCTVNVAHNISRGMDYAIQGFDEFSSGSDVLTSFYFTEASQYLYNAMMGLGLLGDTRMYNTSVYIWGGDSPTDAKATEMANPNYSNNLIATNDASNSNLNATTTAIVSTNDAVEKFLLATGTASVQIALTETAQASK